HLWVDSRSGFLAGGQEFKNKPGAANPIADGNSKTPGANNANNAAAAPAKQADKSQVVIRTNGPFHYDFIRDLAWFDSPPQRRANDGPAPLSPEQVEVTREHQSVKKLDQLTCNHLELQFRRRAASDQEPSRDTTTGDREIESALATARSGEEVV